MNTSTTKPQWPAPVLVNGALQVSPSQLTLQKRCTRQWGFKYLFGREPAFGGTTGGKAFHAALQRRYRASSPVAATLLEDEMLREIAKGFEGVEVPGDDFRTCGRYQNAVRAYNRHYVREEFETLAVEMPVVVHLGLIDLPAAFWNRLGWPEGNQPLFRETHPLRIELKAIIDRLIRFPDGLTLVADTKTSKDWKQSHQVMWERAGAPKAYAYAVESLARTNSELGLPRKVHGFMLDSVVIRREEATLKRPRKPGSGIEDHLFQRIKYYYTPDMIEEWRVNALRQVRGVLMEWAGGDLSHNDTSCASFYGSTCPYLDVCRESTWDKRRLVLGFDRFQPRSASPFEKLTLDTEEETQ